MATHPQDGSRRLQKASSNGRRTRLNSPSKKAVPSPTAEPAAVPGPPAKPKLPAGAGGVGRPPFVPTEADRRTVMTLAGLGLRQEEISQLVVNPKTNRPIDEKTLRIHFEIELATGPPKANAKVAESLYRKAIGDGHQSVAAAIFWAKTRMGWRERTEVSVDIKSGVLVAPQQQTPQEWIESMAVRNALLDAPDGNGRGGEG